MVYELRYSCRWAPGREMQALYFFQKCHLLEPRIEELNAKKSVKTQSFFLGRFERETFELSQGEWTVFASRPQLTDSHPAYFLVVSQCWKYTLGTNYTFHKEVVCSGSLCGDWHNHTMHYEHRCSMRWALSKAIQGGCFLQKCHFVAPRTDCSEDKVSTQGVFLDAFESETF